MNLKWIMVNRAEFTAEFKEYKILVNGIKWYIYKEGTAKYIDCCFYHPNIATGELAAKVQAERAMEKIIQQS